MDNVLIYDSACTSVAGAIASSLSCGEEAWEHARGSDHIYQAFLLRAAELTNVMPLRADDVGDWWIKGWIDRSTSA
jgi:hypothetical protein